ncbi:MAG TPA: hypothetical protein VD788_15860, partial [Candidatus Polarisedimenticolaceae bacterium]|nr:hypothetical protein [Candidatus Polarisedimenticolaceae bacterium]
MRYAIVLALMIVVAVGIVAADKQTELPSVEQVIAKHVEAIGGEQAYLKYDSRTLEGTMSLPTAGLSGVLTAVAMAPDKT